MAIRTAFELRLAAYRERERERGRLDDPIWHHWYEVAQRLADEYHDMRLAHIEPEFLPSALNGDQKAIASILKLAAEVIRDGSRLTPRTASYVADGLDRIARGQGADHAFGRKRGRGESDRSETRRADLDIALYVAVEKSSGIKVIDAQADAAELSGVSIDYVIKVWKDHGAEARRWVEFNDQRFGKSLRKPALSPVQRRGARKAR